MASMLGPMTHANGCHISVSPDIYLSSPNHHLLIPPPSGDGCTEKGKKSLPEPRCLTEAASLALSLPHKREAWLSSGALTTLASVFCPFHLRRYVALKATWWVTGELSGCLGFFSAPQSSRYTTTARNYSQCLCLLRGRELCAVAWKSCGGCRRAGGGGSTLSLLTHPSTTPPLPPPGRGQVVGLQEG